MHLGGSWGCSPWRGRGLFGLVQQAHGQAAASTQAAPAALGGFAAPNGAPAAAPNPLQRGNGA